MAVPLLPAKLDAPPLVTPEAFADYHGEGWHGGHRPPEAAILCYHRGLAEHVAERHGCTRVSYFLGDYFLLDDTGGRVAIAANFGIGAPAAAFQVEDLAAAGVRRILSIGTSGSLQPAFGVGALAVVDEALRDEGTSHHYLPAAERVRGDAALADELEHALRAAGHGPERGTAWTTDAPYRETALELRHWRERGILAVEMELAAIFAVAQVRGVALAGGLVASDVLSDEGWTPDFHAAETLAGLDALIDAALGVLAP